MKTTCKIAAVAISVLALATVTFAAEPVTTLDAEDLLRLSRPTAGECYLTKPPATVTGAPERLFAWAAAGGRVMVRVPVPADGYYAVRSKILWGPWAEGRFGRFVLTGGTATFPNAYQGWYGTPPDPPYRLREQVWGIAHLSAPAVNLSFEPAGGNGRLMILGDLRLEPRAAEALKPEELERKVPAVPPGAPPATKDDPALPLFDLQQQRGTQWTVFVPRASETPKIDGKLEEWSMTDAPIVIDGLIVPKRGWASPAPQGDADLSARVKLSWDDTNLYLAAVVRDDMKTPHTDKEAWDTPFGCDSLVVSISPGWPTSGCRARGSAPLQVMYGLSNYSPGASGRPLADESRYVVVDTEDGYTIEATLSFTSMGWTPAMEGDRFPLGLILVDVDPNKAGGKTFDQYGWNYGPGSTAGTGEARLMGASPAAGEIIPERSTLAPGAPLRYVGTIDAQGSAMLKAIEVVSLTDGTPVASFDLKRSLPGAGRYRVWGQLPLPMLPSPGHYDLRIVWDDRLTTKHPLIRRSKPQPNGDEP